MVINVLNRVRDSSGIPRTCGDIANSPTHKVVRSTLLGNAQNLYSVRTGHLLLLLNSLRRLRKNN